MEHEEVQAVLAPLIEKVKKSVFVEGYEASDSEAMGMILSKYFEWSGVPIMEAAVYGLEDANFHSESQKIAEMVNAL